MKCSKKIPKKKKTNNESDFAIMDYNKKKDEVLIFNKKKNEYKTFTFAEYHGF